VRTPVHTGQFRRDTRRAQKRGKDMTKLRDVLSLLIAAEPLPPRRASQGSGEAVEKLELENT
jgi:mRNA interferase YafQ